MSTSLFIQGLRPTLNDHGQLDYRLEPGRFLDFVRRARTRHDTSVLVIDEINRADLARVFGELMYLLEYRDQKVPLAGGGEEKFFIPTNVRIIGTMNTADRSVTLIDHALRRRFAFWRLEPDHTFLRDYHQNTPAAPWIADLVTVLEEVNRSIDNPDRSLGTSFFLTENLDPDVTADIWQTEIEPYLEEIFFDRPDAIVPFRWKQVSEQLGLNDDSSG
jgi:5-methylcytosine-specific restriction protein B